MKWIDLVWPRPMSDDEYLEHVRGTVTAFDQVRWSLIMYCGIFLIASLFVALTLAWGLAFTPTGLGLRLQLGYDLLGFLAGWLIGISMGVYFGLHLFVLTRLACFPLRKERLLLKYAQLIEERRSGASVEVI